MISIKEKTNQKDRLMNNLMISASLIFIALFNLRNITKLIGPSILWDEFGYWATAAFFAGKDWSSISSTICPYYSYGYGFILFPLIKLTSNMNLVYQLAIIQNVFMVLFGFLILRNILNYLFPHINKLMICLISLIVMFYPSIIHNSQIAWSETLLMFIFLISLFFFMKGIETQKVFYFVSYGISLSYLYMIHQRTIGIVITGVTSIVFLYFIKKINLKCVIIFFGTFLLIMGIGFLIDKLVYTSVWDIADPMNVIDENVVLNANTYSGQMEKIKFLFSKEGIYLFFIGFFGKIYYAAVASLLFVLWSLSSMIKSGYRIISSIIKRATADITINNIIYLYLGCCFLVSLAVASFFLIYITRIDMIAYGRYTDFMLPIIIAIGIIEVMSKNISKKVVCCAVLFVCLFQLVFNEAINRYNLYSNYASCSPITFFFRNNDIVMCEPIIFVVTMATFGLFFAIICYLIISMQKKRFVFLGIILAMVVWIIETQPAISNDINIGFKQEANKISEIISDIELPIYYVISENEDDFWICGVQMQLRDRTIYIIKENSISNIEKGLVIRSADKLDDELIRGEIIVNTDIYIVEMIS